MSDSRYGLNYNDEEIIFIKENCHLTDEHIARVLPGRTKDGILAKRKTLNIKKERSSITEAEILYLKQSSGKKTFTQIWKEIKRSKSTVHKWIKAFNVICLPYQKQSKEDYLLKARLRMKRVRERERNEMLRN